MQHYFKRMANFLQGFTLGKLSGEKNYHLVFRTLMWKAIAERTLRKV